MSKNYEFFVKTDLSKYSGKWIAIMDQKIVATGDSAEDVYKEAKKKYPNKKPSIAKIPSGETLVLVLKWL